MKIEQQKYHCPKCGIVTEYISLTFPELEGKYCQQCYAKWIKENFPKLEELPKKNND